jgi:hypothetical protein
MPGLLKKRVTLDFIVNPFYLYCIAFSLSVFVYLLGWSKLFPVLSAGLVLFLAVTSVLFIFAGYILVKKPLEFCKHLTFNPYLNDIMFFLIIILGLINVLYMGYLPVLDRSHNYREFGIPVIDPLFNTLSIFFSVFFFQSFLETRKKRFLIYFIIILIFQIIIFRRSTIIWIIISSSFLFLIYRRKISILMLATAIIFIPLFSYCFGLYGNTRSKLASSFIMNDLGASDGFKQTGVSHNHYMTYLYVSSPLANLQENIDKRDRNLGKDNFKDLLFYCLVPESFTARLEKPLHLSPPSCYLISPELITGSFYMVSFFIMGWGGMIIMFLYLFVFILLCLFVIRKWATFGSVTFSLLSAAVSLLIFSNFLNRLDVILMLFVYPVLFHLIYNGNSKNIVSPFPDLAKQSVQ